MNKTEWDAMETEEKDQAVWDHFPEIAQDSDDWVLSHNGGKSGFDFFDTEREADWALLKYKESAAIYDEATVVHRRDCRHFTTDRNACALVLDEIDRRNLRIEFEAALSYNGDDPSAFIYPRYAIEWALRLSPDFICYCAVKAVENENT